MLILMATGYSQATTVHAHSANTGATEAPPSKALSASLAAPQTIEIRTNRVAAGPQARSVFRQAEQQRSIYSECDSGAECHPRLRRWRNSLDRLRPLEGLELLRTLSTTLNGLIRYQEDSTTYGEEDHWATPVESLTTGYGDCEDYAILKYLSLRELGFSAQQLRIRIGLDPERNVGHAVLTVDMGGQTYVLDSLSPEPKVDNSASRYIPVYSVNERDQWLIVAVRSRNAVIAMQPSQ